METFDVMVLGAGPAGLSAAIYASRGGVRTCVLDAGTGGAAQNTPTIENYPGAGVVSGYELVMRMRDDAARCGATIAEGRAATVRDGTPKTVRTAGGEVFCAHALVFALGSVPVPLGLANEEAYLGAGLSYCATCDGNFFRGRTVAVAGRGKHGAEDAAYLARLCAKVYAIGLSEDVPGTERISGAVTALHGMPLSGVTLTTGDKTHTLALDGLFVCMGYTPSGRELYAPLCKTTPRGTLVCDGRMQTSASGIFAAGDIVDKPLRQIVTAVADGALAGTFAAAYAKQSRK